MVNGHLTLTWTHYFLLTTSVSKDKVDTLTRYYSDNGIPQKYDEAKIFFDRSQHVR